MKSIPPNLPGVTLFDSGGRLEIVSRHLGPAPGFPESRLKRYVAVEEYLKLKDELAELRAWSGETRNEKIKNAAAVLNRKLKKYSPQGGPAMWELGIILALSPRLRVMSVDRLNELVGGYSPERQSNIIRVYTYRLRQALREIGAPGKIQSTWSRGVFFDEDLQNWFKDVLIQIGQYDRVKASADAAFGEV